MINKKFCALSLAFLLCACGKKSKSQSGGNSNKEQQKEGEHEPNQQVDPVTQQVDINTNENDKNGLNKPNGGNEKGKNDKNYSQNENKEIPKKQDKNSPTGLKNLGNSCYLNSSVQQLYNIEAIRNFVLNGKFNDNDKLKALQEMFKGMSSDSTFFDPGQLPYKLGYQGKQEDAHEFLSLLLYALDSNSDTEKLVKETFFFNFKESMTKQCPNNHTTDNTFVSGPLACSIVDPFTSKEINSLNEILEPLFVSENLSDIRCDICDPGYENAKKEGKLVDELKEIAKNCPKYEATKQTQFSSLPRCLVVVLKRFGCNETSCYKINHQVTFPLDLEIKQEWCAENLSENIPSYTLTGVIVHSGSLSGGHYWSYVKKGEKWYKCNDDTVSEVHMDNTLLNSLYGDGKKSDSAYILFYSKAS